MKQVIALFILAFAAQAHAGCTTWTQGACVAKPAKAASAPPKDNSALQAACIEKIKPTLKGAERIRDIGEAQGKLERDIMIAISENGGKVRSVACSVQKDGTLKLTTKGYLTKS